MKLTRLEIRRLPGIDTPFAVDFAPDTVNLITGPNGSGKSSLVRAVRALLHQRPDDPYLELAARWEDGDGSLSCERNGHQVQWQRRGRITEAPKLPGPEAMGAYLISCEDLTAPGQTETHIAAELQTLLAGGYDLDAVLASGPFVSPPRPQKLAREVEALQRAISDKEAEYGALHEELQTLSRLESELRRATRSVTLLGAIDDALALADAMTSRSALEATLIDEFPGGMDRLRGDEMERLDQARARLEQKQQAMALEQAAVDKERAELEHGGAGDPADLEALQAQLADARDALAQTEQQLAARREQVAVAQQALAHAARRLGSDAPDQVEGLDQAALEALERQVEKVLGLREKIRALSGQLMLAQGSRNPTGRPQGNLRVAREALRDWLALARLNPLEGVLWGGLGIAAALGSLRLLDEPTASARPELLLLIGLAIGLPLAMLGRFLVRLRDRDRARSSFLETDIEPPLGWTEGEIRSRLERLEAELEAATQHDVSMARAADLREQLNAQRGSLERARDRLRAEAETLGISAETRLETSFMLWCRHLQDWQQQHQRLTEQQLRLDGLQRRQQQQLEEAANLLQRHGIVEPEIAARTLAALVHQLLPRIRRHTDLHGSVQARERRLAELQADSAQIRHQIGLIFESTGLREDDIPVLRQKIEQFPAWQQLERERRELGQEIARLENRLGDHPDLTEQARQQRRQVLEALRETHVQLAEQRDPINRHIAEIHTRHADVLKRRELERLGIELEQTQERLGTELDAQMVAAAGQLLIEDVRAAHRTEHEPALLTAADRWLDRFTRHRYRLAFEDGRFQAIDTRSGRHQPLSELSTGGRVQLLLAVRLAWIEQQERHTVPLPVFMDEVLTTSDADRYRAVVGAVRDLIDKDRQIFYLTAHGDDAQAWWEWLGEDHAPHPVDMAEIRRGQVRQLEFRMPQAAMPPASLPKPDTLTAEQWAQAVGVGAIDPWQDSGQIHIAHLLRDDLVLAHRLLQGGLERLGELERLLERLDQAPTGTAPFDQTQASELVGRIQATRLIVEDWRRRHPRPVNAEILQRSGLLSERFLPRVVKLADQIGGDPVRLIDCLGSGAVPRFRSEVTGQLRQWLEDEGHLAPDAPPDTLSATELALETGLACETTVELLDWLQKAIADPLRGSGTDLPQD